MKAKPIVADPLRVPGHVTFYNGETVSQASTIPQPQSNALNAPFSSSSNYEGYSDKQHNASVSSSPLVVLSNGSNQPIVRNTSHLKAETHISFVRPSLSSPAKSLPHASGVDSDTTTTDLSTATSTSNSLRNNGLMLFYNPTSLTTPTHTTGTTNTSLATTSTASVSTQPSATGPSKIKLKSLTRSKSETVSMLRDDSKRKLHAHKGRDIKPGPSNLRSNSKGGGKQSPMMFVQVAQLGESQFQNRDFFNSFERIGSIDRLGFGSIFEATEKSYEYHPPTFMVPTFALKEIPYTISRKHQVECYIHELTSLISLTHKNLVSSYDVYFRNDVIYMVLEYCEAGALSDISASMNFLNHDDSLEGKNAPFSESQVIFICHEVLLGLHFLHSNGIIHRDIKGSNILLTRNGEIKIGDFGCCDSINPAYRKFNFVGTPHWMAPELISSLETMIPYDERIDIWSLGITVIELAERDVPHSSVHHARVLSVIVSEPSPSLSGRGRLHFSPNLSKFVATCLTKEPQLRPKADVLLEHPLFLNVDLEAMCKVGAEFGCSFTDSNYTKTDESVSVAEQKAYLMGANISTVQSEELAAGSTDGSSRALATSTGATISASAGISLLMAPPESRSTSTVATHVPSSTQDHHEKEERSERPEKERHEASQRPTERIAKTLSFSETRKISSDLLKKQKKSKHAESVIPIEEEFKTNWPGFADLVDSLKAVCTPDKIIPVNRILFGDKFASRKTSSVYHGIWHAQFMSHSIANYKAGNKPHDCTIKIYHHENSIYSQYLDKDAFSSFNKEVLKEISLLHQLQHPNVVSFIGLVVDPVLCLVIDYCSKGSLYTRLADLRFPFNWANFFTVTQSLVEGLNYLHTRKPAIYHRNVHATNILIDSNDAIKLADFGSAASAEDTEELKIPKGFFTHIPPEVFSMEPYTVKSEIYSLGVVMWEMAMKCLMKEYQSPYSEYGMESGLDFNFPLLKITQGLRPTIPPNCPLSLKQMIVSMWSHHPFQRPTLLLLGQFANLCLQNIGEFEIFKVLTPLHAKLLELLDTFEKVSMYYFSRDSPDSRQSSSNSASYRPSGGQLDHHVEDISKEYLWSNSSGRI